MEDYMAELTDFLAQCMLLGAMILSCMLVVVMGAGLIFSVVEFIKSYYK